MDDQPTEIYCPSCGTPIQEDANFCPQCGEPNRRASDGWGPAEETDRPDRTHETAADEYGPDPAPGRRGATPTTGADRRRGGRGRGVGTGARGGRGRAPRPDDPGHANSAESIPWRRYLPPHLRSTQESKLRVAGVAIGLGLLGMLLLSVFAAFVGAIVTAAGAPASIAFVVGAVAGYLPGFIGLGVWYLRRRGFDRDRITSYIGIRRPTFRQLGLVVGAWVVILIGMAVVGGIGQLLIDLLGLGDAQAEQQSTELLAGSPELVVGAILMMFLVVGPAEEFLFRGIVQGRLRERLSRVPAIAIASVFFALIHAPGFVGSVQGVVLGLAVLTVGGTVFGAVYEYTQNIVVVSLLHGLHNSMVVLFIYAAEVTGNEEVTFVQTLAELPLPV